MIASWLIPAEPERSFFASLIQDFSVQYGTPLFEPHVTVHVARNNGESPEKILTKSVADFGSVRLSIRGVDYSKEFTKIVFVQFAPSPLLSRMSNALQRALPDDRYHLNPHLSLIYKTITLRAKKKIVSSIKLPFTEVIFDSAEMVICPALIKSREDVEAFRVVATQSLNKPGRLS